MDKGTLLEIQSLGPKARSTRKTLTEACTGQLMNGSMEAVHALQPSSACWEHVKVTKEILSRSGITSAKQLPEMA